jgi:putative lipoprotein
MAPAVIGSTWSAVEINGAPPVPRSTTTLIFSDQHRAGGKGGCNNWFADISLGDGTIQVGNITATGKGCGQAIIEQEKAFFAALRQARLWQLGNGQLVLLDEAGVPLVRFAV